MAKNKILYIFILLLYSCLPPKRNDNREQILAPIVITQTDTIYVHIDIPKTIQTIYIESLRKYIGTKELTGKNDGVTVEMILKNCGFNIPQPWCACYLNQALIDIGLHGPLVQPAYTPSWFMDERRLRYVRDKFPITTPFEQGWVGGIFFRNLGRIGHVAVILEDFGDGYVLTIEGNTNAQGGREGDGVYLRIRHKSEFYMMADWLTQYT